MEIKLFRENINYLEIYYGIFGFKKSVFFLSIKLTKPFESFVNKKQNIHVKNVEIKTSLQHQQQQQQQSVVFLTFSNSKFLLQFLV